MIKAIRLQDFQSHKKSELMLTPGMNCVVGTSDSGKSAILRGLTWLRANRPSGVSIIRTGTDTAIVEIEVETKRGEFLLTRARSKSKNEYRCNDAEFVAVGKDVPEEVTLALGLQDINTQRQLDPPFLIFETPGRIAAIFNKFTKLDTAERLATRIAQNIRQKKQAITNKGEEIEKLGISIEQYDWLESFKISVEIYEEVNVQLEKEEQKKEELLDLIEKLDNADEGLHQMEMRYQKIVNMQVKADGLFAKYEKQQTRWNEAEVELSKLEALVSEMNELAGNLAKADVIIPPLKDALDLYDRIIVVTGKIATKMEGVVCLSEILNFIDTGNRMAKEVYEKLKTKKSELRSVSRELSDVGVCPYCGSSLNSTTREFLMRSLEKA